MFTLVGNSLGDILQNINSFHGHLKVSYYTKGVWIALTHRPMALVTVQLSIYHFLPSTVYSALCVVLID
jgi:hypothetical protein